jgi:2-polyprenyl-3-methyl-5-hydroxy-6-metoxy-1,4-benzoquinol methylase
MNATQRSFETELMDDPTLDPALHRDALAGLRRINRVSGSSRVLWSEIARLLPGVESRPLRVLDIGCGGGDVVAGLARRFSDGQAVVLDGCDLSPFAVRTATAYASRLGLSGVRFFEHDVLRDEIPETYDVVTCSLFLHHFNDADAGTLMRRMIAAARQMVLIDDLCRTRLGYLLAWVGCRVLSRSPVVHHDGPVSVARAFNPAEIRKLASEAGLNDVRIQLHWPQRFLLTARPS